MLAIFSVSFYNWICILLGWCFTIFCLRASFQNKLQELNRIELMQQQAYNLDLAPSDYYLFWFMVHVQHSEFFNNQEKFEASVKDKNCFQHGIEELIKSYNCVKQMNSGLFKNKCDHFYFECLTVFVVTLIIKQICIYPTPLHKQNMTQSVAFYLIAKLSSGNYKVNLLNTIQGNWTQFDEK